MTIDKNDPKLTAFVLGELTEAEANEIRAALDADIELRAEVEAIHRIVDEIEEAMQSEPLPIAETPRQTPAAVDRPDKAKRLRWPQTVALLFLGVVLVGSLAVGLGRMMNTEIALNRPAEVTPESAEDRFGRDSESCSAPVDELSSEIADADGLSFGALAESVPTEDILSGRRNRGSAIAVGGGSLPRERGFGFRDDSKEGGQLYRPNASSSALVNDPMAMPEGEPLLLGGTLSPTTDRPDASEPDAFSSGTPDSLIAGSGRPESLEKGIPDSGRDLSWRGRGSIPPERLENQAGGASGAAMGEPSRRSLQFSQAVPVEARSNSGRERLGTEFPAFNSNTGRSPYSANEGVTDDSESMGETRIAEGRLEAGVSDAKPVAPALGLPYQPQSPPASAPAVADGRPLAENGISVGAVLPAEDGLAEKAESGYAAPPPSGGRPADALGIGEVARQGNPLGFGGAAPERRRSDRGGFENNHDRNTASGTRIIEPADLERLQLAERGQPAPAAPTPMDVTGKPLQMMATPRIVIQEEEKELSLGKEGPRKSGRMSGVLSELETLLDDPTVRGKAPIVQGNSDAFLPFVENSFLRPEGDAKFSTFSIDVDSAAYGTMRRYVSQGQTPPPDSVRLEEYVNYFHYDYAPPAEEDIAQGRVFATQVDVAPCPWEPKHLLARIGIKGREYTPENRPSLNLVFLVDVSGSMSPHNKLPLVKQGLRELVDRLQERDRVAVVTYAGSSDLALPSISAREKRAILDTVDALRAAGSTAGGQGIQTAYETARKYYDAEAENRVILCTDGDFNVGVTDNKELETMIAEEAKSGVYLTVLGFGMGNYKDDRLKTLAMRGNGNYGYIDTVDEARRLLVDGLTSTMLTIAKDVKIQVDFNPARVAGYRLLGYENRKLKNEDFKDDRVDAGEIGAGHSVTALYEIVPAGVAVPELTPPVDPSRYERTKDETLTGAETPHSDELMFVKLRYKLPEKTESVEVDSPIVFKPGSEAEFTPDSEFAAAVALYGMLLRGSRYSGSGTFETVLELARPNAGEDKYRNEFVSLVEKEKARSIETPKVGQPPMASAVMLEDAETRSSRARTEAAPPVAPPAEPPKPE